MAVLIYIPLTVHTGSFAHSPVLANFCYFLFYCVVVSAVVTFTPSVVLIGIFLMVKDFEHFKCTLWVICLSLRTVTCSCLRITWLSHSLIFVVTAFLPSVALLFLNNVFTNSCLKRCGQISNGYNFMHSFLGFYFVPLTYMSVFCASAMLFLL
jgi:hypothetical protein